jgi:hypothetical protein
MIARLAMVGVQLAEEAIIESASRRPLPLLTRDAVLVIVGADTDYGREIVSQYCLDAYFVYTSLNLRRFVRAAGWDVWELSRSRQRTSTSTVQRMFLSV